MLVYLKLVVRQTVQQTLKLTQHRLVHCADTSSPSSCSHALISPKSDDKVLGVTSPVLTIHVLDKKLWSYLQSRVNLRNFFKSNDQQEHKYTHRHTNTIQHYYNNIIKYNGLIYIHVAQPFSAATWFRNPDVDQEEIDPNMRTGCRDLEYQCFDRRVDTRVWGLIQESFASLLAGGVSCLTGGMSGGGFRQLGGSLPAIASLNTSYSTSLSLPSPYLLVPPAERQAISDVRRTFCLFVTFDLLFISLLWIIELNVSLRRRLGGTGGRTGVVRACCDSDEDSVLLQLSISLWDSLKTEVVLYDYKSSFFDIFVSGTTRLFLYLHRLMFSHSRQNHAIRSHGLCSFCPPPISCWPCFVSCAYKWVTRRFG